MEKQNTSHSVRSLRCRMGWSQSELAVRLGVSSTEIRAWEAGESEPGSELRQILEHLFHQSETSMLEILQSPQVESKLEHEDLACIPFSDLAQDSRKTDPV